MASRGRNKRCDALCKDTAERCSAFAKRGSVWCASHQDPASRWTGTELDEPSDTPSLAKTMQRPALFDTLSGEVRPIDSRDPGELALYACGPTVYDHPHLGHARSALTYDVLRRYLEWSGVHVRHVANITDIDDKIIDRARSEGRTETEVAAEWEAVYVDAMNKLGVLEPHERPKATEWVPKMVEMVEQIIDAGSAYPTSTGVYLRVRNIDGYGDLVDRGLDELRDSAGARVAVDDSKEDPLDFALWKAAKPGEPSWPSPWGPGRPGWHIECAAMSLGILGDGFDIHGGGADLAFPHHTNERAEALAAGRDFARHWMHNAMLNVDGAKMAKSTGNYRTVAEMVDEHPLNGRAFRLLVLQTHYRKTMEVNAELLTAARSAIGRFDALARRTTALHPNADTDVDAGSVAAFREAMDNDLGTPEAVAVIFDTVRKANTALDANKTNGAALAVTALDLAKVLGMAPDAGDSDHDSDAAVEDLVARRQAARAAKDWTTADVLRENLSTRGVVVEDTPAGPLWRRR